MILQKLKKLFTSKEEPVKVNAKKKSSGSTVAKKKTHTKSLRKGELGEYKIEIQLDQLPKDCRYLSDLLIENPKSKTGYSQVDHVVISPYCIFVIETKNYQGEIKGTKDSRHWYVNKKFKMYNPLYQNYGHQKALEQLAEPAPKIPYISMISFTMRCRFNIDPELRKIGSDQLIVYDTELSEFITRKMLRLKAQNQPTIDEAMIKQMYETFKEANIIDPKIRKLHTEKIKTDTTAKTSSSTCSTCGKTVSDKVKNYCLANTKRFNGKIYCFEHQKTT
ncbi:nuclease-related domain-containing protein [Evansella sp. AB-P1]|uniref:nuclease-related domain-containing protein n=1 Tax=Evansella sp. AB-P1 TaxID=3037653 RepID=UPI00241C4AAF|nr:nuclease-related domain-containing protein [Evansella sp. AB-P1]MDG5790135.1 nuclease-related domain-containing protein [Evansella sp. AB-P1]